jgi:hypothetical protein
VVFRLVLREPARSCPLDALVRYCAQARFTAWLRNRESLLSQAINVKPDCLSHILFDLLSSLTCRHTARQVRRVSREACGSRLDDNQILAHFSPACFKILFRVPGASSSPGRPGTVTSPAFDRCLY